jgi:hypothetical protein
LTISTELESTSARGVARRRKSLLPAASGRGRGWVRTSDPRAVSAVPSLRRGYRQQCPACEVSASYRNHGVNHEPESYRAAGQSCGANVRQSYRTFTQNPAASPAAWSAGDESRSGAKTPSQRPLTCDLTERATRFELATLTLARTKSAISLPAQMLESGSRPAIFLLAASGRLPSFCDLPRPSRALGVGRPKSCEVWVLDGYCNGAD